MPDVTLSTTLPPPARAPDTASAQQGKDGRFYLVIAIASACLVFLGFVRAYYLKSLFGKACRLD